MNAPVDRNDRRITLPWVSSGTLFLTATVARLLDGDLAGPSLLPGWSRGHVAAHVARNAEAIGRLATWAGTGVETPMYRDRDQRNEQIEQTRPDTVAAALIDMRTSAAALEAALAGLDETAWAATVRNPAGLPLPMAAAPWLRAREVWIHAVDINAGATWADIPPEVVDALLDEIAEMLSATGGCPDATLVADDRGRQWTLGTGPGPQIAGAAADLVAWAAGRAAGRALRGDLPVLPRWV